MMEEVVLATARHNPHVDPSLSVWGWEIAVYLFLGGLTAGIMFFSALMVLLRKGEEMPFSTWRLALWGPVVLSVGMTTLFLDLSHKLFVYRFYTTFQPLSPMSWGSWILILVYPASVLLILATLRRGYPTFAGFVDRFAIGRWVLDRTEASLRPIAALTIPIAIGLGIYTGILLSGFMARPFWNSGVLGPLFLVSGLSTAAALVALAANRPAERHFYTRIDMGLILVELGLVALLLINLSTAARPQLDAFRMVFGGEYTFTFWFWFVALGLLLPLLMEWREINGAKGWVSYAPIFVLVGGYILRQLLIDVGQAGNWTHYATQFDPQLLLRLTQ